MSIPHPKGVAAAYIAEGAESAEVHMLGHIRASSHQQADDHSTDDDKVGPPPSVPAPLPSFARLVADTGPLISAASIAPLSAEMAEAADSSKRKVKKACFLCKVRKVAA